MGRWTKNFSERVNIPTNRDHGKIKETYAFLKMIYETDYDRPNGQ